MAIELLSEIKKQAAMLSADEMRSLASFLNEEAEKKGVSTEPSQEEVKHTPLDEERRRKNLEWLKANREKYGGQYVVLDCGVLVAVGQTYKEAREKANAASKADSLITYLSKPDEVAETGGWL